jgi:ankyrin repeat protein
VRLLLERGADPNARDVGDNALPLHFAAGGGPIDSARLLIEAGSDVRGVGDLHELEAIGWATVFAEARRDVVALLVERGARHHIFSAIALGDHDLIRNLVADEARALDRRLSKFEQKQSALHYVIAPPDGLVGGLFRTGEHYRTLELLIELGADLEAKDAKGRTPLDIAMLLGDAEAMRMLHAAGAAVPTSPAHPETKLSDIAPTIRGLRPMIGVRDIEATVAWYRAVGFEVGGTNVDSGTMNWASVHFGSAEIMFTLSPADSDDRMSGLSLWMDTDRLDELYALLKERQMERARAALEGRPSDLPDVAFAADLYTAFYGQREFAIRDPNGVTLNFCQPVG